MRSMESLPSRERRFSVAHGHRSVVVFCPFWKETTHKVIKRSTGLSVAMSFPAFLGPENHLLAAISTGQSTEPKIWYIVF